MKHLEQQSKEVELYIRQNFVRDARIGHNYWLAVAHQCCDPLSRASPGRARPPHGSNCYRNIAPAFDSPHKISSYFVRDARIELAYRTWKVRILPLN